MKAMRWNIASGALKLREPFSQRRTYQSSARRV